MPGGLNPEHAGTHSSRKPTNRLVWVLSWPSSVAVDVPSIGNVFALHNKPVTSEMGRSCDRNRDDSEPTSPNAEVKCRRSLSCPGDEPYKHTSRRPTVTSTKLRWHGSVSQQSKHAPHVVLPLTFHDSGNAGQSSDHPQETISHQGGKHTRGALTRFGLPDGWALANPQSGSCQSHSVSLNIQCRMLTRLTSMKLIECREPRRHRRSSLGPTCSTRNKVFCKLSVSWQHDRAHCSNAPHKRAHALLVDLRPDLTHTSGAHGENIARERNNRTPTEIVHGCVGLNGGALAFCR